MAIVQMDKIRLLTHKSVGTKALNTVQKMGVLEITEITHPHELIQQEKSSFQFDYASGRLDFAVEFLSRYERPKKGRERLRRIFEGNKVFASDKEISDTADAFVFNEVVDKAQNLEEELNVIDAKIKALDTDKEILTPWIDLPFTLDTAFETVHTKTLFFTGEKAEAMSLCDIFDESNTAHYISPQSDAHHTITYLKEDEERILKTLGERDVELVILPKRPNTPREALKAMEDERSALLKEREATEEELRNLAVHLPKLKIVSDDMYWKKERYNMITSTKATEEVLVFEGWCPTKKVAALRNELSKDTDLFELFTIEAASDEEPPVEIENNTVIRPFETITRLYGLPGPKDLDPTVFLAGFFFLFFGLSLTDVGYGLFLFAVIAIVLWLYRVPKGAKPLLQLLMIGGLASFLIGLLFGGYLGIDMKYLPGWARTIQQFDPIASPLPIFYLSLMLGVIQIVFGLLLKIFREARNQNLIGGLLDQVPWLLLFISLILLLGNKLGYLIGESAYYTYVVYAALISIVLTAGRSEKTIVKKFLMGLVGLYQSINYFSDVLSYSRLLALGLATSALAFAVNLIAGMVADMIPYVGTILMVIVLIVGHLFNLVVNLLGAFIHSARLQFVEFFGKFIIGTGRNFKAFKRDERYVVVE